MPTCTARPAPAFREATLADVPRLQAMFAEFVRSTQYAHYVGNDPAYSTGLLERLITHEDAVILVADREGVPIGMLGLMVFQHPMSGARVATEAFWWLDPAHQGYGVYLLRRGERWAAAKGATKLSMMAPADKPRVAEIYAAVGYDAVEITFQKDLR